MEPVRILAVDDVAENLTALDALLRKEGVELLLARSGIEALELLLVHDVALALLDVQMPGMDGFELAELMRGIERTRNVPIIFLTAVATDERRRFRGYEAGAVDYLLKPVDPPILRNKVEVFVELYRQRRELGRQRDEHAAALARLKAHNDNSPLAIAELDCERRIIAWSEGAQRLFGWRKAELAGYSASEVPWVHGESVEDFNRLMSDLVDGRTERETRLIRFSNAIGHALDCECYCSALRDPAGGLTSINLQILDVTERRRFEETQRLLIGELNHRVKNTLASVQAIAKQTLRYSSGPSDFAPTFLGRIHALANAHSLLSNATWQGASLRGLIEGQLAIGSFETHRFKTSGPDIDLAPEPALHLALVLHELVTNAHKYGALSQPDGIIRLDWRISDNLLQMDWIEQGGPKVTELGRKGFGTTLIERSLKAEGGSAVSTYHQDGVAWKITLPSLARAGDTRTERDCPAHAEGCSPALSGTLKGQRFLIIEDEPIIAMELAAIIEDEGGLIVATASDKETAFALVSQEQFDCALLDGNLKGASVEDIADALAERNTPFVFVSGYGREHLPARHGEAPLLGKPFKASQLIKTVAGFYSASAQS